MKTFKKLLLIALVFTVATSCNKKDDDSPQETTNANITGTWSATAVDYTSTTTTEFQGVSITQEGVGEAINIDYTLTFTEDPNNVTSDGSYDIILTTTIQGQTTTQTIEDLTFINTGIWARSGDVLSVTINGETDDANIELLDDTNLRLSTSKITTSTQSGATITAEVNAVLVFIKQ